MAAKATEKKKVGVWLSLKREMRESFPTSGRFPGRPGLVHERIWNSQPVIKQTNVGEFRGFLGGAKNMCKCSTQVATYICTISKDNNRPLVRVSSSSFLWPDYINTRGPGELQLQWQWQAFCSQHLGQRLDANKTPN
jgi:hypothetical protein